VREKLTKLTLLVTLILLVTALLVVGVILWRSSASDQPSYVTPRFKAVDELTSSELEFFFRADDLPPQYSQYISPDRGSNMLVPGRNRVLGDLRIGVAGQRFDVQLGDHTQFEFHNPNDAIEFIDDILRDRIVFQITDSGVFHFPIDDESALAESGGDCHVWSGPLRP